MVALNVEEYFSDNIPELASEFGIPVAKLNVVKNNSGWFYKKFPDYIIEGDKALEYTVVGQNDLPEYMGEVLVRQGKVYFFDRYPMGGGPFRLNDFNDIAFKNRAKLISKSIEKLVELGNKEF